MPTSCPTELRRRAALIALLALSACASTPPGPDAATRAALAPTGTLRIAVYPGSPTSMVTQPGSDEPRGLSVDIGHELARRLGVPSELKSYQRVAEVLAAIQRGEADITVTNGTPERAKLMDFTAPLLAVELGVLVMPGSPVTTVDGLDKPGLRIGVSQGGSSERVLGERFKQASIVPLPSMAAAREALQGGRVDAFATNKAILHEMADRLPGARVLDGRWGLEHMAIGTARGRDAALPWLRRFGDEMIAGGQAQRAAERAGLRGAVAP